MIDRSRENTLGKEQKDVSENQERQRSREKTGMKAFSSQHGEQVEDVTGRDKVMEGQRAQDVQKSEQLQCLKEQEQQKDFAEEEEDMKRILGFTAFASSKNKNHQSSACEMITKNSKVRREYRQYMNRRGGFNRNLDKI